MATTLATLRQRTLESIGDFLTVAVTTTIAANTSIISTNLNEYDGGADDYFKDWYVYITDEKNIGVERQVSDYAPSSGTITVRGASLQAEDASEKAVIWVCRHSVLQTIDKAINRTLEEVFPAIHRVIDDMTLITGNILPNAHFEDWDSSTKPDFYTLSNVTAAETTTAGLYRGQRGTSSVLVTATSANGYMYITSDDYPRLLDLMGKQVSFSAWAYPSKLDDASLVIYTLQADGTAQTLTSTTTCPANQFTLLELNDQSLNDDLVEIQLRFKIATNSETCYFDDALVTGRNLFEYLIPNNLQNGYVNQVYSQVGGYSDIAAYDIHPRHWSRQGFRIIDDGDYKYLRLDAHSSNRRLRLIGVAPLDALSSATASINLEAGGRTNLLVAYASYLLYEMEESPISSEDTSRYERESAKRYAKYMRLLRRFRMISPSGTLRV